MRIDTFNGSIINTNKIYVHDYIFNERLTTKKRMFMFFF